MAEPVKMPRQGLSVESCILIEWLKDVGDEVNEGELLFTYETDKSTFELEAEVEGILLEKFFEEGDEVPVFTNVCVVGEKGEDVDDFMPEEGKETETQKKETDEIKEQDKKDKTDKIDVSETPETTKTELENDDNEDLVRISPRAQKLADKNNLDIRYAEPTGPEGRIIERDIEKLLDEGPVYTPAAREQAEKEEISLPETGTGIGERVTTSDLEKTKKAAKQAEETPIEPEYEEVELTNIRKQISSKMYESVQSTAQLTLDTSFDASEILEYRKKIKANKEDMDIENITINDMILYTVSRTLLNHEKLNAHFTDEKIKLYKNVNLGVAVDTERGLMVPTIFKADLKSLNNISREIKNRAEECREGSINPDYLSGATFTVTNLGTLDIESFTPILNPPQTGILGVNTIIQRTKKVDGEYINYPAIKLSLTFDHRALDGAPAARFLKDLKNNLENFTVMMAR